MATIQIRVDDSLKHEADVLFTGLGLDTTTAVRIFLNAAVEHGGIPFSVKHRNISASLQEAIDDSRQTQNLNGPFDTAKDAITSMLED